MSVLDPAAHEFFHDAKESNRFINIYERDRCGHEWENGPHRAQLVR